MAQQALLSPWFRNMTDEIDYVELILSLSADDMTDEMLRTYLINKQKEEQELCKQETN